MKKIILDDVEKLKLEQLLISELPDHYRNKTVDTFVAGLAETYGIGKTTLYTKIIKPLVVKHNLKPQPKKRRSNGKKVVSTQKEIDTLVAYYTAHSWSSKNAFYKHLKTNKILGNRLPSKTTIYRLVDRAGVDTSVLSDNKRLEKRNKALSLYNEGQSIDQISSELKLSDQTIKNYLREFGHSFNNNPSPDFQLQVLDYYYQYGTPATIQEYGVPQSTQVRWRKKWGMPARYNSNKSRIYNLDQNYFKIVDTEGKAYLIGLLATDGNVYKNVVCIELKAEDKDHLGKVSELIESNKPIMDTIHFNKETGVYKKGAKVAFISRHLAEQLHKLGITENKTNTLSINFDLIPEHLHKHFWRGAIDGDGSLFFNEGLGCRVLEFYGNEYMVLHFKEFVEKNLNFSLGGPWSHHGIYKVSCQTKGISQEIAHLLYNNSVIALPRKNEIAKQWYIQKEQPDN